MRLFTVYILLAVWMAVPGAWASATGNLLSNPSFESAANGKPTDWHLFIQPMEGAEGVLDDAVSYAGDHSVRLHNPQAYETEAFNNWSQNIISDLSGKTLSVSGYIRTGQVEGGAALWVQCYQRNPLRELHRALSSREQPLTGTRDWTQVAMEVETPNNTDFVTVRCVLQGAGMAWFDAIEVRLPGEPAEEPPKPEAIATTDSPKRSERSEPSGEALKGLLEANRAMASTIQTLREANESLRQEIRRLRDDLDALRDELANPRAEQSSRIGLNRGDSAYTPGPDPETPSSQRSTPFSPTDLVEPFRRTP